MANPKPRRLLLAAAIIISTSGTISAATWLPVNRGLPVTIAGVTKLTVDPKTPSIAYAATAGGTLFKTTDGGGSWTPISAVAAVYSFVIDSQNSSTLYVATGSGIVKSTDGGESWTGANTGLSANGIYTLVADPRNPSTLYAPSAGSLFKSTDGAQTWNLVGSKFYYSAADMFPSTGALFYADALVIDPKNSALYAAIYVSSQSSGLFKSTDGGSNWYPATGLSVQVQFNLQAIPVFDPVNPSTIYLGYNDFDGAARVSKTYLYKSTDDGATWKTIGDGFPANTSLRSLAIDPTNPSAVYATYAGVNGWGLVKSTDGGQTFHNLDTGLPPYNTSSVLAISPTSPSTVYAGYVDLTIGRGRLVKSADGGANWNTADNGLTFVDVRSLAIDPANASTIYAGMGKGGEGVFKSVDGGEHWSGLAQFHINGAPAFPVVPPPTGEPGSVNSLLISSANPNVLYAATTRVSGSCIYTDKLFFKSTDGGVNWTDIANPPQGGCGFFFSTPLFTLNPANPDELILGGEDDCDDPFLDHSPDDGLDWSSLSSDFGSNLNALAIDPTNPATLYAGSPEGVFKSTNAASAWSNIGLSNVNALVIDRQNPNTLYAATSGSSSNPGFGGMFKSIDGGANWTVIDNGLSRLIAAGSRVTGLATAPDNTRVIYLATSGSGIYKSSDGGANWAAFNDGLTDLNVRVLTVASKGASTLYAVTPGGTFKVTDETQSLKQRR